MNRLPIFPDLRRRWRLPERMDQFDSDPERLHRTLEQFERINRTLTRSRHLLKRFFVRRMLKSPGREYHLIDLGAGACDTAVWLLEHCRRLGLRLRVTACDHDSRVVAFARRHHADCRGLRILEREITDLNEFAPFDFVFANHLLHHLTDGEIVALLQHLDRFPQVEVLLNDLRRSRFAYAAYFLASQAWFRNSFAHYDGRLSICKGFRRNELLDMAKTAQTQSPYSVRELFPGRIVLYRDRIPASWRDSNSHYGATASIESAKNDRRTGVRQPFLTVFSTVNGHNENCWLRMELECVGTSCIVSRV